MNLLITLYSDHYQDGNENRDVFKDITWSPYDRITFKTVESFEHLCSDNYSTNSSGLNGIDSGYENGNPTKWNGIKQCMHLIEEENDHSNYEWKISPNKAEYIFDTETKKYNFLCIYAMRFSEIIQRLIDHERMFNKKAIRNKVYELIKHECNNKNTIEFKLFRSLGPEDMVVVFLSEHLKDIISVVDTINKTTIILPQNIEESYCKNSKLFSTVCVFSGFNNRKYDAKTDVDIFVRLNLKENNIQSFLTEFNNYVEPGYTYNSIFCGVSTLQLNIPAGKISFKVFQEQGIFNGSSRFYSENIYSSRTYFSIPNEDLKTGNTIDLSSLNGLSLLTKHGIDYNLSSITSPVADFLFGEYCRLLEGQRTVQWNSILKFQYEATKSFSKYYSGVNKFTECDLLNYMQSALHLINQACSSVSEIPNHNHFYAGSFHDLLKAYYGIIDMLFDIGYGLPHAEKTTQHPITFAICLNSTACIESKIFTRTDIKNRIVIFFLPYDTFWNYAGNIKELIHEVFHYIAPYDREKRAKSIVNILYTKITKELITEIASRSAKFKYDKFSQYVTNWIDFLIKRFDDNALNSLCNNLKVHFPEFFILSNPDWTNRFINNSQIINVILFIENKAKKDIILSFDNTMAYLDKRKDKSFDSAKNVFDIRVVNNCLKERELSDNEQSIIDEYLNGKNINKGMIGLLNHYTLAAKEAFCDMWAIKITGMSIPAYIVFLIKTMTRYYDNYIIKISFSKKITGSTNLYFSSTIIRIILLIYKHFSTFNTEDNSDIQLKEVFKGLYSDKDETGKFIKECIDIIAQQYVQFVDVLGKHEIDALCDMAFYMVEETFSEIEKYDSQKSVEILRRISETDLSCNINMDSIDELTGFIGMQKLQPITTVSSYTENIFLKHTPTNCHMSYKRIVTCIGELMETIQSINDIVLANSKNERKLWYRGVCSAEFNLLPSIFRNGDKMLSIYVNQANMIKNAYFNTTFASDVWNLPIEQKTAFLQHYGIPTNLLDFSLDPLVSLYFAVFPDRMDDRMGVDSGVYQPVIYVFDPMAYSLAIRRMTEGKADLSIPNTISSVTFDINKNEEEKEKYFVGDMSYNYLYEHNNKYSQVYVPDDRGDPYPAPIVVQQSNPRIVAQSGTFVAYSLHAKPQTSNIDNRYNYLDLLTIQRRYLEFLNKSTNQTDRFIFPIYLSKEYISDIRASLKHLNISTGKFYPELSKIFGDVMSGMS